MKVHHLNCVEIDSPMGARAIGHCLLLEYPGGLVLVEAGIGLLDTRQQEERIGADLIAMVGFRFDEHSTAFRQIAQLGFTPGEVHHCVLTHLDPDHIGGLADFPGMQIHVAREEMDAFESGHPRYLRHQLAHRPVVHTYAQSGEKWFGLEARRVDTGFDTAIWLVPLPGHTEGHCGVAIQTAEGWIWHVGDAYYYRIETVAGDHPVAQLAAARAVDNARRLQSLEKIKQLMSDHPEITVFSFHDPVELLP